MKNEQDCRGTTALQVAQFMQLKCAYRPTNGCSCVVSHWLPCSLSSRPHGLIGGHYRTNGPTEMELNDLVLPCELHSLTNVLMIQWSFLSTINTDIQGAYNRSARPSSTIQKWNGRTRSDNANHFQMQADYTGSPGFSGYGLTSANSGYQAVFLFAYAYS